MCFGFVHLFNCRVAEPRLAGRVVVGLFIFVFICPSMAEKVKTSGLTPPPPGGAGGLGCREEVGEEAPQATAPSLATPIRTRPSLSLRKEEQDGVRQVTAKLSTQAGAWG